MQPSLSESEFSEAILAEQKGGWNWELTRELAGMLFSIGRRSPQSAAAAASLSPDRVCRLLLWLGPPNNAPDNVKVDFNVSAAGAIADLHRDVFNDEWCESRLCYPKSNPALLREAFQGLMTREQAEQELLSEVRRSPGAAAY